MPVNVSELLTNTYVNHLNDKQYMIILKPTQIAAGTELFIIASVEHQFSEPYQKHEFQTFICATASLIYIDCRPLKSVLKFSPIRCTNYFMYLN